MMVVILINDYGLTECAPTIAPYKIPSEIRFLAPLPSAPTGKLLKGVMKTMAQQPADASPAPARH